MSRKGKTIPVQALWVTGDWGFEISRQSTHECGKIVSLYPPGNISGTHFC